MELKVSMSYVDDEKFEFKNSSNNSILVDMYKPDQKKTTLQWNFYYVA